MDHRCGTRQNIPVLATLYPRMAGPVRARVRNMSISGMFVEIRPHAAVLPLQSLVEVEFTIRKAGGATRRYRCLAMVARATPEGLGLMFDRLNPPAVVRLLAARQAASRAQASAPALYAVHTPGALRKPQAAIGP